MTARIVDPTIRASEKSNIPPDTGAGKSRQPVISLLQVAVMALVAGVAWALGRQYFKGSLPGDAIADVAATVVPSTNGGEVMKRPVAKGRGK